MIMGKMTEKGKSNAGIIFGVLSLICGGGSLVGGVIFAIATVFAGMGLGAYEKGSEGYLAQQALVNFYQMITYILGFLALVLVILGIVLLVIFIRRRKKASSVAQ